MHTWILNFEAENRKETRGGEKDYESKEGKRSRGTGRSEGTDC